MSDEQRYDDARRRFLTEFDGYPDDEGFEPTVPRSPWPFWLVAVLAAGAVFALTVAFGGVRL